MTSRESKAGSPVILEDTGVGSIEIETSDESELVIRIQGWLNEDLDLFTILPALMNHGLGMKSVLFELADLTRINSIGVRNWIQLLKALPTNFSYRLSKISETFVDQLNSNPGALGNRFKGVLSFYVPYRCARCELETRVLFRPQDVIADQSGPQIPSQICSGCGSDLEIDDLENEYFRFLKCKFQD